jgi:hypothetical protein
VVIVIVNRGGGNTSGQQATGDPHVVAALSAAQTTFQAIYTFAPEIRP